MNLKRLGRFLGVIAAVAMLAMVIQGCSSSGGDSGAEQDLQDQLDALQGDVDGALMGLDDTTLGDLRTMYDALMAAVDDRSDGLGRRRHRRESADHV